jgi:CheY-like chemotaxis protein
VLVADDSESVRQAISLALLSDEYEVHTVRTWSHGLDVLRFNQPDLLFVGLELLDADGLESLRVARSLRPDASIYVMTEFYSEPLELLRNLVGGRVDFDVIRKPVDTHEIALIGQTAFEGARQYAL